MRAPWYNPRWMESARTMIEGMIPDFASGQYDDPEVKRQRIQRVRAAHAL